MNEIARHLVLASVVSLPLTLSSNTAIAKDKDNFEASAHGSAGAHAYLRFSSDPPEGYVREAGDFDRNTVYDLGQVQCGETQKWFEVWSRRNFSNKPLAKHHMDVSFWIAGSGVRDPHPATFERSFGPTLKSRSHWKGEDFGIKFKLICD